MKSLLIDVESTGFSRAKNSIVEIGWAFTDDDFNIVHEDQIYILAQEGKEASQEAIDVNGYDEELWLQQGAVTLPEAQDLLNRKFESLRDTVPAWAHNAMSFDKPWVNAFFPNMERVISEWRCSMALFRQYCKDNAIETVPTIKDPETKKTISPGTLTLQGVAKIAGVPYVRAHGALDDCRILSKVLNWAKVNKLALAV